MSATASKPRKSKKVVTAWSPPAATRALMLRTCGPGMTAHGGFIWPRSGYVFAPDWNPTAECGNGLHGLLWGAGNASLLAHDAADWLVVEIDGAESVELSGKVKVPRGNVVFVGSRADAVALIQAWAPAGTAVVFGTATAGNAGTATAGYAGTATAGDAGTATAGTRGTATAGLYGVIAIEWYDGTNYRKAIAEVDGVNIKANVKYRCETGNFVEAA